MLTKEEFQRDYVRMMDSVRKCCKGSLACSCVKCENCTLNDVCHSNITLTAQPFEIIEAVEKWSKEHPIVTNQVKYKEVFGFEPKSKDGILACPRNMGVSVPDCREMICFDCKHRYWNSEYKEPTNESEVK